MAARLFTRTLDGSLVQRDLFETCMAPLRNAVQPERFQF
jgi:hypothetical protein